MTQDNDQSAIKCLGPILSSTVACREVTVLKGHMLLHLLLISSSCAPGTVVTFFTTAFCKVLDVALKRRDQEDTSEARRRTGNDRSRQLEE